jgi:hypothetical protein
MAKATKISMPPVCHAMLQMSPELQGKQRRHTHVAIVKPAQGTPLIPCEVIVPVLTVGLWNFEGLSNTMHHDSMRGTFQRGIMTQYIFRKTPGNATSK